MYKRLYQRTKTEYQFHGGAISNKSSVNLMTQTTVFNHPKIRDKGAIGKMFVADDVELKKSDFVKTKGQYVSIWYNPATGEIIPGTTYPAGELPNFVAQSNIDPDSTEEDKRDWLEMQQKKDKHFVIVSEDQMKTTLGSDKVSYTDSNHGVMGKFFNHHNIKYEGTHFWGKIQSVHPEKIESIQAVFEILKKFGKFGPGDQIESIQVGLEYNKLDGFVREFKTHDKSEFYKKPGKGWVKAPYQIEIIIQDKVEQYRNLVNLPSEKCVAMIH